MVWEHASVSGFLQKLLIPGIQMKADANHGCEKRIMFLPVDDHPVQAIIIQDPVVDALGCCALVINFFVGISAAWDLRVETDIPLRPGLDDTAILCRGTAILTFRCMMFAQRAAPHEAAAGTVRAVGNHTETAAA